MKILLCFSLLGSILGMVSDWALLYDPNGAYLAMPKYSFLQDLPVERIWFGHFLGGISIPLSLLALPALFEAIKADASERLNTTIFLLTFMIVGIVYHLSVLPFRLWLDLGMTVLNAHVGVYQFLEAVCGVGILILGLGWYKVAARLPKWQHSKIWANPILTYLLWVILFALFPNYGGLVWMMGMNLSVLICQIVLLEVVLCPCTKK